MLPSRTVEFVYSAQTDGYTARPITPTDRLQRIVAGHKRAKTPDTDIVLSTPDSSLTLGELSQLLALVLAENKRIRPVYGPAYSKQVWLTKSTFTNMRDGDVFVVDKIDPANPPTEVSIKVIDR